MLALTSGDSFPPVGVNPNADKLQAADTEEIVKLQTNPRGVYVKGCLVLLPSGCYCEKSWGGGGGGTPT